MDRDRINGWLNASERRGNFDMGRLQQFAEAVGNHFFERSTLRFFDGRVLDAVYFGRGSTYFVTSERFSAATKRRYTVRVARLKMDRPMALDTDTVGEFQEYRTAKAAHAAAARFAQAELDRPPTPEEEAFAAEAEVDIAEKEAAAERRRAYWSPAAVAERGRLEREHRHSLGLV